jgi:hypothetical protein
MALHRTAAISSEHEETWTRRTLRVTHGDWLVIAPVIGLWACVLTLLAVGSIGQM